MNKKFAGSLLMVISVFFVVLFTTCEIGLGSTVDINPPAVAIDYPPVKSIIRGDFVMSGTANDDEAVKSLSVSFAPPKGGVAYGPYPASYDVSNKTWRLTVNAQKSDGTFTIPDGTYVATATAIDKSNRSTSVTTVYEIDNTPPVLYIARPGSIDSTYPDSFGNTLSIEGQVADASEVEKLILTVYAEDKTTVKGTYEYPSEQDKTVPQNISLVVARFDDAVHTQPDNNFYKKIYDATKPGTTQKFYYTIEARDKAREYKGQNILSDDKGNVSTEWYLDGTVDVGYKTLYDMKSGAYYTNLDGSIDTAKQEEARRKLSSIQSAPPLKNPIIPIIKDDGTPNPAGVFTLNPNKSPTYIITTLEPIAGTIVPTSSSVAMTENVPLSIQLIPNLDGDLIDPGNANGEDKPIKVYVKKITGGKDSVDFTTGENKTELSRTPFEKKGKSWNFNVSIGGLGFDSYAIYVEGKDTKGNLFESANGARYAFTVQGSHYPPVLALTTINEIPCADSKVHVKKGSAVTVKGTAESKLPAGSRKVTVAATINGKTKSLDLADTTIENDRKWTLEFPANYFDQEMSNDYVLQVKITDQENRTAEKQHLVFYDANAPEVVISVTPYIDEGIRKTVNGKISVQGTINDLGGLAGATWAIAQTVPETPDQELKKSGTAIDFSSKPISCSFDFIVDTTNLADKENHILRIQATDRSGNIKNVDMPLYVDQSSDAPQIIFSNAHNVPMELQAARHVLSILPAAADSEATTHKKIAKTQAYVLQKPLTINNESMAAEKKAKVDAALAVLAPLTAINASAMGAIANANITRITDAYEILEANTISLTPAEKLVATKNIFGIQSNNRILAVATDDDGIAKIEYRTDVIANPTAAAGSWQTVSGVSGNPTSVSFSIPLPSTPDRYGLEIRITDCTAETDYKVALIHNFYVAVEDGPPLLQITSTQEQFKSGSVTVEGKISDASGFATSGPLVPSGSGSVTEPVLTDTSGKTPSTAANWTDTFTAPNTTGTYSRTYTAKDIYGNISTVVYNFKVDNTPPAEPTVNSTDGEFSVADGQNYYSGAVTIKGTAADAGEAASRSGIARVEYTFDATGVRDWTPFSGAETWTGSLDCSKTGALASASPAKIKQGANTLYLRAVDRAGNTSLETSKTLYLDWALPVATVTSHGDTLLQTRTNLLLQGEAHDDKAFTDAGSTGTMSRRAAEAVLKYSKNGGTAVSVSTVTNLGEFDANPDKLHWNRDAGTWSYTLPASFGDGLYVVTLTVKDDAGKLSTVSRTVQVDTMAPDLVIKSPANKATLNTASYTIKGTAHDSGVGLVEEAATVQLRIDINGVAGSWTSATALAGTEWEYTGSSSAKGKRSFQVKVVDKVGNTATSLEQVFYYDSGAPVLSISTIGGAADTEDLKYINASSSSLTYSGTIKEDWKLAETDGFFVKVLKNGVLESTTSITPDTGAALSDGQTWTYSFDPAGRGDGIYTLIFTATDAAEQTAIVTRRVTVDKTAPVFGTGVDAPTITSPGVAVGTSPVVTWYKTDSLRIAGTASDATSGLELAEYKVGSGEWSPLSGTTSWTGIVAGLVNGDVITVRLKDRAGNMATHNFAALNIDMAGPSALNLGTVAGVANVVNKLTNAATSITVTVKDAADASGGSGVDTIRLLKIGNKTFDNGVGDTATTSKAVNVAAGGTASVSLSTAQLDAGSNGGIVFRVADKVGNYSDFTLFSITKDTAVPSDIVFLSPENNKKLNKTVILRGTALDDQGLESVVLQYSKFDGTNWSAWSELGGTGNGKATGTYSWTYDFDTTKELADKLSNADPAQKPKIKLKAIATDKAGNIAETLDANQLTLTIDQNSDRPVIRTSISLAGMTSGNPIWQMQTKEMRFTVEDDDGPVTSVKVRESHRDNAGNWTTVSDWSAPAFANGTYTYTYTTDNEYQIEFQIVDKTNTEFTSATVDGLDHPVLTDGSNIFTADSLLYVKVDTEAPQITEVSYTKDISNANPSWLTTFITEKFGGTTEKFNLQLKATDSNGIQSVTLKRSGAGLNPTQTDKTYTAIKEGSTDYWVFKDVGTNKNAIETNIGNGSMRLDIVVKDNAGTERQYPVMINVDNTAPTVTVFSPAVGVTVSGNVTVRGSLDSLADISYVITKGDEGTEPPVSAFKSSINSGIVWGLYFDGGSSPTETHDKTLNKYIQELLGKTEADMLTYDTITELKLWIRAVDQYGNASMQSYILRVDPQGTRPNIVVSYPDNDQTLGGTIKLYGTAYNDKEPVTGVWVQIISREKNPDGYTKSGNVVDTYNFIGSDAQYLKDKGYPVTKIGDTSVTALPAANDSAEDYGIQASFSGQSWSLTINSSGEFDHSGDQKNEIAIRLYAVNAKGRSLAADRLITIDKDNPRIGNSVPVYLVQYDNGNVNNPAPGATLTASREYTEGMFVTGQWYLRGSVEDKSGIASTKTVKAGITESLPASQLSSEQTWGSGATETKGYIFSIPVGSATPDDVGSTVFTLQATEVKAENPLTTSLTYRINYDNKKPVFGIQNIPLKVVNSNNFYTMSGKVSEVTAGKTESGFERLAVWFERKTTVGVNPGHSIFDPMLTDVAVNRIAIPANLSGSGLTLSEGLYWKEKTVGRTEANLNTLSLTVADANVRVGSLVKIGGSMYLVASVSGTNVTLRGNPKFTDESEKAWFAIAQIVDNTVPESSPSGGTLNADGYFDNPINDDGDKMIESVTGIGTVDWAASINSKNIPDGPLTIHYVAFDKAGNYTTGKVENATVQNNKPRIAKIKLGIDANANNVIEATENESTNEEKVYWSAVSNNDSINADEVTVSTGFTNSGVAKVTIKTYAELKPEIVGGNGALYYSRSARAAHAGSTYDGFAKTPTSLALSGSTSVEPVIKIGLKDILKRTTVDPEPDDSLADGTNRFLSFTIWDSSEGGLATSETTQNAVINIVANIAVRDSTAPTMSIKPFYWTDKNNNSLYTKDPASGHIELEGDLDSAVFDSSTALKDLDPKVSGIITLEGSASDNKVLTKLYVAIDQFLAAGKPGVFTGQTFKTVGGVNYYLVAERSEGGVWVATDKMTDNGWKMEISGSETFTQEAGHSLRWKFHWDTAKIAGIAATDVEVQVLAEDKGKPALSGESITYTANTSRNDADPPSAQTTEASHTALYKVDVVPYVTEIVTRLSAINTAKPSVYNRTAQGRYPVYEGELITLKGFNLYLASNTVVTLKGTALVQSDQSVSSLKVNVGTSAASGLLSLTVNGVSALNNENKNDRYNMLANGENNDNLTDNLELDVWQYTTVAKPRDGEIQAPELKIGPAGQVGLAFVNGNFFFHMPGLNAGGGDWVSQRPFEMCFAPYYESAFAFDAKGNTYGVSTNQDANDKHSAYTTFFFNRTGGGALNMSGNYAGGSYRRRLMSTTSSVVSGIQDTSVYRAQSPAIVTSMPDAASAQNNSTNRTYVYIAYYDTIKKEIRYHWGSAGSTLEKNVEAVSGTDNSLITSAAHGLSVGDAVSFSRWNNVYNEADLVRVFYVIAVSEDGNQFTVSQTPDGAPKGPTTGGVNSGVGGAIAAGDMRWSAIGGQLLDIRGGWSTVNNSAPKDTAAQNYTAVAGPSTAAKAGKFVSLDVISGAVTKTVANPAGDVVVMVWFDASANKLMYTYNTDPCSDDSPQWQTNAREVDSSAGWYAQVKVDSSKGVHIAYYSMESSDLKYAKLDTYTGAIKKATIDSYQLVGTQIRLDVAKSGGNEVPYISYYSPSAMKTKIAVQKIFDAATVLAGVSDGKYTGNWELSYIPSPNTPKDDTVNVGVHKESGDLAVIPTVTGSPNITGTGAHSTTSSKVGGNGTTNPVVAYTVMMDQANQSDVLEMAQKK